MGACSHRWGAVSADDARDALQVLAGLIAADIRAGTPALAVRSSMANNAHRRPGRPKAAPYAVARMEVARAA